LGVNFNFERAPLKLQRSIKSKNEKKTMKRKREKRGRSSRQPVEKNRNHRGSVIFWSPIKADQKEHSDLRNCGQLEAHSGSP
jgi:hypothetical protein